MNAFPFGIREQGRWKWVSLAFLAIPALFYILSWAPAQAPETFGISVFGPVVVGGKAVVVGTEAPFPIDGSEPVTFNVRLCEGCRDELRGVALAFGDAKELSRDTLVLARGDANGLQAVVPAAPRTLRSHLWIELRQFDGVVHRHAWKVTSTHAATTH